MLFSTLKKNIETPPPSIRPSRFVYWLNGRWFLQIVDRDSITKIVVLVSEPVRGRSRATELPCFKFDMDDMVWSLLCFICIRSVDICLLPLLHVQCTCKC